MTYIIYYRVSTTKQDMDRQIGIVQRFLRPEDSVLATYQEKQSASKKQERKELTKAIIHAKHTNAKLLVSGFDRLSRNLHFLTGLMEQGVDFIAADNPNANKTTIHIMAALAQDESERTSQRVKDGMRVKREQGSKQGAASQKWQAANKGMDRRTREATKVSACVRRKLVDQRKQELAPLIEELRTEGYTTLRQLATKLNSRGYKTPRGSNYTAEAVRRIL